MNPPTWPELLEWLEDLTARDRIAWEPAGGGWQCRLKAGFLMLQHDGTERIRLSLTDPVGGLLGHHAGCWNLLFAVRAQAERREGVLGAVLAECRELAKAKPPKVRKAAAKKEG